MTQRLSRRSALGRSDTGPSGRVPCPERHGLEPVATFDPVVLPFEGDPRLVERNGPGVRDRDAVSVAGEIGEDRFRSGEWSLGEDDPCVRRNPGKEEGY